MSVIRVNKNKNYTTMSNYHLREKEMSLKAKGLLSQMLSLPDDWDYSIEGLTKINKEGLDAIRCVLKELEEFGYLQRTRIKDEKGKFIDVEYTIFEAPAGKGKNPSLENPTLGYPTLENPTQLNTNINNKLNNKITNNIFKKPTIEEIMDYCIERGNNVDPERFYNFYEANGWVQGKARKPIKDWKACVRTWEQSNKKDEPKEITPEWFNEKPEYDIAEQEEEFNDILDSFK